MDGQAKAEFWIQWAFFSSVGWFFGFMLGSWIGGYIGVGAAQWYTWRRVTYNASWWLVLTALGGIFGWLVSDLVVAVLTAGAGVEFMLIASTVHGGLVGFALGITQWFFLRRMVDQAGLWIGASIVAWAIAPFLDMRVVWYGSVAAVVTGLALVWLLKRPHPEAEVVANDTEMSAV